MGMVKESISFERGIGSKSSLGLGRRESIKKQFDDLEIKESEYVIKPDLSIVFNGNLNLSYIHHKIDLPSQMIKINGYLDLESTNISELPPNLKISNYLDVSKTNIKTLPEKLIVQGNFYGLYLYVDKIPGSIVFGGNLNLFNSNIEFLPDGLRVGGSLNIMKTKIKKLPRGLHVGGDLIISKGMDMPKIYFIGGKIIKSE